MENADVNRANCVLIASKGASRTHLLRIRTSAALAGLLLMAGCSGGASSPSSAPQSVPESAVASAVPTESPQPTPTPDPLAAVQHDLGSLQDRDGFMQFYVTGTPDWQAVTADMVWVGNDSTNELHRIDPTTNALTTIALDFGPCNGLAVGFGAIWSADCDGKQLVRVDQVTGEVAARIPTTVGSGGEGLTGAGEGFVWMIGSPGKLIVVNPATNAIAATIDVPAGAVSVAVGFGAVWVTDPGTGSVLRIDPVSLEITATIAVGGKPRFLTAGEGAVWVLNQADGTVARIDPATASVVATVDAGSPGKGGCIATGGGSVWTTTFDRPLTRIDASTNQVLEQYLGFGGDCVSFAFGSVWLSNLRRGTIWRIPFPQ